MATTDTEVNAVIEALKDDNRQWHTIREIAAQKSLPVDSVLEVINRKREEIVLSANKSQDGENLYSLREIYDKKAPFLQRLLGSLKNRVD